MKPENFQIPGDLKLAWEREFSFLNCSLLAEQFTVGSKRHLGKGLSFCIFLFKGNKVGFYRSEKEEKEFSEFIGKKCLNEAKYYSYISNKLEELTDKILDFIEKNKTLDKENIWEFMYIYNQYLPFHLAVYWGVDYLVRLNKESLIVDRLNHAWKYNELTYPKVESWLKKHEDVIQHLDKKELSWHIIGSSNIDKDNKLKRPSKSCIVSTQENYLIIEEELANEWHNHINNLTIQDPIEEKRVKGKCASQGIFTGKVRIIKDFNELETVRDGEILVTPMTRPQFNHEIKKAGAIITDEGGVLCHAAIVSREFNIPCIVGTQSATKIFKDGDLVEVNATEGIARKVF